MKKPVMQRAIAIAATGSIVAITAGCASSSSDAEDGTVTIGMLESLSGDLAAYGEEANAGFTFVVDKINESGGIESLDGAEIELATADDASDPAKSASEARRLIGKEGAAMIVGTLLTSQMASVSPVADRYKVPVLSEFAGGSNSDYLYSLGMPYGEGYAATLSAFIDYLNTNADAGIETVAQASSNYEAGQQVDKELESRLADAGLDVVGKVPLETGGSDYKPFVTKLDSMDPDIVTGLVTTEDGITLHQARSAAGSDLLYVGGTGGYADQSVWDGLGDEVAKSVLAKNMFAMTNFSSSTEEASLQKLLKEAKDADLGVPIGQNFVQGAQAAWVVKEVLENAGSTDPEDILAAFEDVDIPAGSDQLYFARPGGITFDPETRFMENPTGIIVQWNPDGTQDVVWPEEFAAHEPEIDR